MLLIQLILPILLLLLHLHLLLLLLILKAKSIIHMVVVYTRARILIFFCLLSLNCGLCELFSFDFRIFLLIFIEFYASVHFMHSQLSFIIIIG